MNKSELIDVLASRTKSSKQDIDRILSSFCEVVSQTVAAGQEVKIVGFGTFDQLTRQARTGRNPQTGSLIQIPKMKMPRFRPGKDFKDLLKD